MEESISKEEIEKILLDPETRANLAEAWIFRQEAKYQQELSEHLLFLAHKREQDVASKHKLDFMTQMSLTIMEHQLFTKECQDRRKME